MSNIPSSCTHQQTLRILLFSKNRPLQLLHCLQSFVKHLTPPLSKSSSKNTAASLQDSPHNRSENIFRKTSITFIIYYKSSFPAFSISYEFVKSLFHSNLSCTAGDSQAVISFIFVEQRSFNGESKASNIYNTNADEPNFFSVLQFLLFGEEEDIRQYAQQNLLQLHGLTNMSTTTRENAANRSKCAEFVMFLVDDTQFIRDADISKLLYMLKLHPSVLYASFRLSNGSEYCGSANCFMKRPSVYSLPYTIQDFCPSLKTSDEIGNTSVELQKRGAVCNEMYCRADERCTERRSLDGFLFSCRENSEYDWALPFDISCTIYRKMDVQVIFETLHEMKKATEICCPNDFELQGCNVLCASPLPNSLSLTSPFILFYCEAVAVVVSVNRVQSSFVTPIQWTSPRESSVDDVTPSFNIVSMDMEFRRLLLNDVEGGWSQLIDELWGNRDVFIKRTADNLLMEKQVEMVLSKKRKLSGDMKSIVSSKYWVEAMNRYILHCMKYAYPNATNFQIMELQRLRSCLEPTLDPPYKVDKSNPLVSWLIPVYNGVKTIKEAVDSCLYQHDVDDDVMELVVVDDASTDGTYEILSSLMEIDSRIHVVRNETQRGVAAALSIGCSYCRGTYIARLDADDLALPDRLKHQLSYMECNPKVGICGTAFQTFNGDVDGSLHVTMTPPKILPLQLAPVYMFPRNPLLLRWHMLFESALAHPTVMMRKSAVLNKDDDYPLYEGGEAAEDHWKWLFTPLHIEIHNIGEILTLIRRHDGSISSQNSAALKKSSMRAVYSWITNILITDFEKPPLKESFIGWIWNRRLPKESDEASVIFDFVKELGNQFLKYVQREYKEEPTIDALTRYVKRSCTKIRGEMAVDYMLRYSDFKFFKRWISCDETETVKSFFKTLC